ncbi:MAG: hypothetical protein ACTHQQ_06430 [Solirubrobacteraceae bacterium]
MAVVFSAALVLWWAAPGAGAANRIYWGSCIANTVSFANLDGTGQGGDLNTSGVTPNCPSGTAMDLPGGRIYWADGGGTTISFANLDNTGGGGHLNTTGASVPNFPAGVATDPATGKIYWADTGSAPGSAGPLSFANLNGAGGGGDLSTSGATLVNPSGVAIDPGAGKIYWANSSANTISFANLDSTGGGGELNTTGATVDSPDGVAIDQATGQIYWANRGDDTHPISFANLDDSGGGGDLDVSGTTPGGADGVAINPEAGKIYWANFFGNTISFANLNNTGGGGELSTTGATTPNGPSFPALLKAPLSTARPKISGGSVVGATLSCSPGTWAPDLLGAFLYQQPVSFSYAWSRNGTPISGATSNSITGSSAGNYTCTVKATNQAGSTTKTSAKVALAASKPTLSLRSKPKTVVYHRTTRLIGFLSSGRRGVMVKLQLRRWPFRGGYRTVAKARTGAHGVYSFERHPSLATEYRVVAPSSGATSGVRTVYVVKAFRLLGCEYTRPGYKHGACGRQKVKAGTYTLRITAEWIYPASVYASEKRKPVYTYYGDRVGSQRPPRTLTRQHTVAQNANGARSTVFRFLEKVVVPRRAYAWSMRACTKTTERRDGFGLPGAPGSHRCGREKIPEKLPLSALG